ncbi:MAG: hypothetical protein R3F43_30230 [bacterium]
MRAADFPGFTRLFGRLITGLFRPRHAIPGTVFAGRVAEVGAGVTRRRRRRRLRLRHARRPRAVPGGRGRRPRRPHARGHALRRRRRAAVQRPTAWYFLNDLGHVRPVSGCWSWGPRGAWGAPPSSSRGTWGRRSRRLQPRPRPVRSLGAHHILDHTTTDFAATGRTWHVIFDTPA